MIPDTTYVIRILSTDPCSSSYKFDATLLNSCFASPHRAQRLLNSFNMEHNHHHHHHQHHHHHSNQDQDASYGPQWQQPPPGQYPPPSIPPQPFYGGYPPPTQTPPTNYPNAYRDFQHEPPIPVPHHGQAFHPELAPEQYKFQYSQCNGRRKVGLC